MEEDDNYDVEEELVAVIPSQQNWKGIGISLAVILFVIGLVAFAVFLMTPTDTGPRISGARIKLENFTSGIFNPNKFNATWHSDSKVAFISVDGSLVLLDVITLVKRTLVSSNVFRTVGGNDFKLSPSLDWVMVRHHEKFTTFPSKAKYTIQDLTKRPSSPLIKLGVSEMTGWESQEFLQYACWVPGKSSGLVMVKENDIYYKPHPTSQKTERITFDGIPGEIFNGITDWIYKARILRSSSAIWISNSGNWMAFMKLNDSKICSISYPDLETGSEEEKQEGLRYAKSDGEVPMVSLHVFNLKSKKTFYINPPEIISKSPHYIVEVKWISEDILFTAWMAREQNIMVQTISMPENNFHTKQIYLLESSIFNKETLPWENLNSPVFSKDLHKMVMIFPLAQGSFGHFQHIVQRFVSEDQQQVSIPLTQGMFEVIEIIAWDENNNNIFFMANLEEDPGSLHLLQTSSDNATLAFSCITCDLPGPPCLFNKIYMASNSEMFLQECLGPEIPFSRIIDVGTKKEIYQLDNNAKLKQILDKFSLPKIKELNIDLPNSPIPATVRMYLPSGFREDEEYTFPLVIDVDRNQRNQLVTSQWSIGWHTYLCSNRDFIIAHIDVRESGLRGTNFEESDKSQLGKRQVEDTYHIIKHLTEKLSYVDTSKVGLLGSHYGGFIAGLLLAKDAQSPSPIINCAITQSPIVDWKNYDAFFTEKHLGPAADKKYWTKYDDSSLLRVINYIPSKVLYLVHEPGDLTHLEQSMIFSRALVDKGILFKQQLYLESKKENPAKIHMLKSMENHFDDCFGPIEDFFRDEYFLASLNDLGELV